VRASPAVKENDHVMKSSLAQIPDESFWNKWSNGRQQGASHMAMTEAGVVYPRKHSLARGK
jgi:hypothetical protein